MCNICKTKPVYEFTNKRKVCKNCFIKWFEKKVLYTIRKFKMIQRGDVIGYENKKDFRSVVLGYLLKTFNKKLMIEVVKINYSPSPTLNYSLVNSRRLNKVVNKKKLSINHILAEGLGRARCEASNKINKIAVPETIDIIANKIIKEIIYGNASNLKEVLPVDGLVIKPLYLFTNKEVELYAKLKGLKFKKLGLLQSRSRFIAQFQTLSRNFTKRNLLKENFLLINKSEKRLGKASRGASKKSERSEDKITQDKISKFIDELEKKHPEVKRAVVNGVLNFS